MFFLALTGFLLYGSFYTAHSAILNKSLTEGNNTFLYCENDGKVIWDKGVDEGRSSILTAEHGGVTVKHRPDPDHRYSVLSDLSLLIKRVSLSDSGIYFCNTVPVVNLTVTPLHIKSGGGREGRKKRRKEGKKEAKTDEDSGEKGSASKSEEDSTENISDTSDDDDDDDEDWWIAVAGVIGVSCMVVVLLVRWRFFTKRKSQQKPAHVYDSINNLPAAEQPAGFSVTQNQAHIYTSITDLPEASQDGEQQRESETVYFLAQNPASNTTGDQQRENECVYFLAGAPASITTDQDQVQPVYTKIQKPVKNT
ncbi:uncharacterized protein LOC131364349 isoform X3 [Hemibagrus wyckioides]|uniref:uncharacterized protein LOC131364349 isoform X3 n=1 Tax=Hemibagrus wyckioides TaxID=337641 RepID=UPI00266C97EE|nr:uncharacterized protein LOC131364349 isoform X3 [Hemibagrus wyckioides]